MKKAAIAIGLILIAIVLICIFILSTNKTFFKDTYIGIQNQEIFIPKYSFFRQESGNIEAVFVSFKSEKILKEEINQYMKEFECIEEDVAGYKIKKYKKNDLTIRSYEVVNEGLYRKIYILYE